MNGAFFWIHKRTLSSVTVAIVVEEGAAFHAVHVILPIDAFAAWRRTTVAKSLRAFDVVNVWMACTGGVK